MRKVILLIIALAFGSFALHAPEPKNMQPPVNPEMVSCNINEKIMNEISYIRKEIWD